VLVAVAVAVSVGVSVGVFVGVTVGVSVGVFVTVFVGVLVGVSVTPVDGVAVTQTMGSPALTGDDPPAVIAVAIAINTAPTINTRNSRCMKDVLS
jgi:Na+/H+ antiporter NhaA